MVALATLLLRIDVSPIVKDNFLVHKLKACTHAAEGGVAEMRRLKCVWNVGQKCSLVSESSTGVVSATLPGLRTITPSRMSAYRSSACVHALAQAGSRLECRLRSNCG